MTGTETVTAQLAERFGASIRDEPLDDDQLAAWDGKHRVMTISDTATDIDREWVLFPLWFRLTTKEKV